MDRERVYTFGNLQADEQGLQLSEGLRRRGGMG